MIDAFRKEVVPYLRSPRFSFFESFLPSRRNPLFDRQLRKMRWPRGLPADKLVIAKTAEIRAAKIKSLKRYTRRYGLFIPAIGACIGAFLVIRQFYALAYSGVLYRLPVLIFGGIMGFSLLCDLYYAVTAINTITQQARLEQWELLRLTHLTEHDILLANYATIQIRAWRFTVIEVGMRVCFCGIVFISIVSSTGWNDGMLFFVAIGILALAAGFILEPLWRMPVVTLFGMTFTTWLDGYATAIMTSFAALVGLLLLQVAILIGSLWVLLPLAFGNDSYFHPFRTIVGIIIVIVTVIAEIYLFFKGVQRATFRLLTRVAFRT